MSRFNLLALLFLTFLSSCREEMETIVVLEDMSQTKEYVRHFPYEGWGVYKIEIIENTSEDTLQIDDKRLPPRFTGVLYIMCIYNQNRPQNRKTGGFEGKGKLVIRYSFTPDDGCI